MRCPHSAPGNIEIVQRCVVAWSADHTIVPGEVLEGLRYLDYAIAAIAITIGIQQLRSVWGWHMRLLAPARECTGVSLAILGHIGRIERIAGKLWASGVLGIPLVCSCLMDKVSLSFPVLPLFDRNALVNLVNPRSIAMTLRRYGLSVQLGRVEGINVGPLPDPHRPVAMRMGGIGVTHLGKKKLRFIHRKVMARCSWIGRLIEAGALIPFGVWVAAGKVEGPRCRSIVLKRARRGIVGIWHEIGQKRLLQRNELEYVVILRVDKDWFQEDKEEACGGPYAYHLLIGTSQWSSHDRWIGGSTGTSEVRYSKSENLK